MKPKSTSYKNVPTHAELYRRGLVDEAPIVPDEFNHKGFVAHHGVYNLDVRDEAEILQELNFNHE